MRNLLRLLSVALFTMLAVMSVQARNTLTIYEDGDHPDWAVPINLFYLNEAGTHSQVIYPAQMLAGMKDEPINSITFYTYDNIEASGGTVRISVGETTQSAFGNYVEGLTQVATISITPGVSQVVVDFDEPFFYGGGNLVVDSYVEEAGICTENADVFICDRADIYCGISRDEVTRSIPKTTFGYGTDAPYAAKVLPYQLTFNTVRVGAEDVQSVVLTNIGNMAFTPSFNVSAPFVVDVEPVLLQPYESLEIPVRFVPTAAGDFNAVLGIDCGEAGLHNVPLSATALSAVQELTVCDSLAIGTLPIDGVYIDVVGTQGQMIYPAGMLTEMVGSNIVELRFYPQRLKMNGGVITLSLMTTEQAEYPDLYSYTPDVLLTGLTTVATLTPVKGSSDFVFVLDQPFEYNGGNLVVDAVVTEAGDTNYEYSAFYGVATEQWAALEGWNDEYYGFEVSPLSFLPKVTFSYQKESEEPQWRLGDVNHDGEVDVADVSLTIKVALGQEVTMFFYEQADLDEDPSSVDVGDVTMLINIVLGKV